VKQRPRVFITGGRRGIGRGIAYGFAEAGYDVVINDIVEDEATAETLAGLRERRASAAFVVGNIAEIESLPRIADDAFAAFGALHAPEVECIGKGKAHRPYEFGVKVSVATTISHAKGGQFVTHVKALPGNPYDGHTLATVIPDMEALVGNTLARILTDKGYRGHPADSGRGRKSGGKIPDLASTPHPSTESSATGR
jgi:NAD(P)-dependent dehydrogenase (short-subunit alcohol dehydrogenase family)